MGVDAQDVYGFAPQMFEEFARISDTFGSLNHCHDSDVLGAYWELRRGKQKHRASHQTPPAFIQDPSRTPGHSHHH